MCKAGQLKANMDPWKPVSTFASLQAVATITVVTYCIISLFHRVFIIMVNEDKYESGCSLLTFMVCSCDVIDSYEYLVRATNAAGSTDSPAVSVTTDEAVPDYVSAPSVSPVTGRSDQLLITWSAPRRPNGVVRYRPTWLLLA